MEKIKAEVQVLRGACFGGRWMPRSIQVWLWTLRRFLLGGMIKEASRWHVWKWSPEEKNNHKDNATSELPRVHPSPRGFVVLSCFCRDAQTGEVGPRRLSRLHVTTWCLQFLFQKRRWKSNQWDIGFATYIHHFRSTACIFLYMHFSFTIDWVILP